MHSIVVRNVNQAFPAALVLLRSPAHTRRVAPRGKSTIEVTAPVATTYTRPLERVLHNPERDANPFFHFFEALWLLAGREDVRFLRFFLERIAEYSDDGLVFHGAYGARLFSLSRGTSTHMLGVQNQVRNVVDILQADPDSRRAVAAIWQPLLDGEYTGKDMPCNCTLAFKIREGHLNMTVFNRSNDMLWGAYGANVVQFSTLLEYVAALLGVPVGAYVQVSDSFHVYDGEPLWQRVCEGGINTHDPYEENIPAPVRPYPLVSDPVYFLRDMNAFLREATSCMEIPHAYAFNSKAYGNDYFDHVARPLLNAFVAYKAQDFASALRFAGMCLASDWNLAATEWLERRKKKHALKQEAHA